MKLSDIKLNPKNPRLIKDEKFRQLVKSLKDFPQMMELRPIVVDADMVIQGGNMRYKALKELKYKDIPDTWVKQGKDLTPEQWQEFVIKDNIGFGEWNWDDLTNEWDTEKLIEWGMDLPEEWGKVEISLPSDEQKEPDPFDGFIVVLKITHETYPLVKDKIENICIEHGIQIDIS